MCKSTPQKIQLVGWYIKRDDQNIHRYISQTQIHREHPDPFHFIQKSANAVSIYEVLYICKNTEEEGRRNGTMLQINVENPGSKPSESHFPSWCWAKPTMDKIGLSGILCLWILGRPFIRGRCKPVGRILTYILQVNCLLSIYPKLRAQPH